MITEITYKKYVNIMINQLYKIIPLYTHKEATLLAFINNIKKEFVGSLELIELEPDFTDKKIIEDGTIVRVVSLLQYMSTHIDNMTEHEIRSDVYKCIDLCKVLLKNLQRSWYFESKRLF